MFSWFLLELQIVFPSFIFITPKVRGMEAYFPRSGNFLLIFYKMATLCVIKGVAITCEYVLHEFSDIITIAKCSSSLPKVV